MTTSIFELYTADGFSSVKKGPNEYAGACPRCGGDDRFIIWLEKGRGWCRQCGWSGDGIQYQRDFHGMSFQEASGAAGKISLGTKRAPVLRLTQPKPGPSIDRMKWLVEADRLIAFAMNNLERSPDVQQWLKTARGLTMATAHRFRLGWIADNLYLDRATWGLPQELKDDGKQKKLFVPSGLLIPAPARLRIRRSNPGKYGKYHVVPGSGTAPLEIGQPRETLGIVVESELDGILFCQEITRKTYIVASGSTQLSTEHRNNLIEKQSGCPVVLQAFDSDSAGAKAAAGWLACNYSGLELFRAPIPASYGKDISDAYLAGLDLNEWLSTCLELFVEQMENQS